MLDPYVRASLYAFVAYDFASGCCPRSVKGKKDALKVLRRKYAKTEDDIKALQTTGQLIGEVLKQLDADKFIVKSSHGPRYVVGCRKKVRFRRSLSQCLPRQLVPTCTAPAVLHLHRTRRLRCRH